MRKIRLFFAFVCHKREGCFVLSYENRKTPTYQEEFIMKLRVNYRTANPAVFKALMELDKAASSSGIDPITYELIKLRASQINGCAFCLDKHSEDLMNKGESMQRILLLSVWREAPIYTEKECA